MDRNAVILCLEEYLNEEGNCAFIHFIDGSNVLVNKKPSFHETVMQLELTSEFGNDTVTENCYVSYGSIMYITTTNAENMKIVYNYNNQMQQMQQMVLDDEVVTLENLEEM